jgi:hypothetical protein
MWTGLAITLFVIAVAVVLGEYYERLLRVQLREETKQYWVADFCKLLRRYEEGCVQGVTDNEVRTLQARLDSMSSRLSVYYPGFTAPTLN